MGAVKITEIESGRKTLGGGAGSEELMSTEFPFEGDGKVLEMDSGHEHT